MLDWMAAIEKRERLLLADCRRTNCSAGPDPKPPPLTGRYMATQSGVRANNLLLESSCMSCLADGSGQPLTCFGPWLTSGCLN
jgi:hypothetical protein